jgi:hypothetical protein
MPYMMYPQKGAGFANTLIHLCDFFAHHPDGLVHESIKDYELGQWLTFHFPVTDRTDLPVYKPQIYINPHTIQNVHPLIRKLISPSAELQKVIDEHDLSGVKAGLHIRRGAAADDSRVVVQNATDVFADDKAVDVFVNISKRETPFFLASDSPETKRKFSGALTIDTTIAVVHDECPNAPTNDRRNIFVDFFLLSRCPKLYITGGNFPHLPGLSTFGYMAAIYGNVPFEVISNS